MASEGWAKEKAALRSVGMPPRCTRSLLQEDVSTIAVWMALGRLGDEAESEQVRGCDEGFAVASLLCCEGK
jgi:hypothetical protein